MTYKLKKNKELLKAHRRYFKPPTNNAYTPMVFNDGDISKGFWTFKECLDASKNPEKDFSYSFEETKHSKDIDKTE